MPEPQPPKPKPPRPLYEQPAIGTLIVAASIFSPVIVAVGLVWLFTRKRKGR